MLFFKDKNIFHPGTLVMLLIVLLVIVVNIPAIYQRIDWRESYVYYFTDYRKSLADLAKQYGITINYDTTSNFLDPKYQLRMVNFQASQLDERQLARFSIALPDVLSLYPNQVISNNIKELKLASKLEIVKVEVSGLYGDDGVFLSFGTPEQISRAFHREFGAALMKNNLFPMSEWQKTNAPNVRYYFDNFNELKLGYYWVAKQTFYKANTQKREDLEMGMLRKLSFKSIENDFNDYVETIFTKPRSMRTLIHKYPRVKAKYLLVKEFYMNISPEFGVVFDRVL